MGDWNRATGWIRDNWFTPQRITDSKTALLVEPYATTVPVPAITRGSGQQINRAYLWYQGGEMFYTKDGSDPMTSPTAEVFALRDNFQRARSLDFNATVQIRVRTRVLGFMWSNEANATYSPQ